MKVIVLLALLVFAVSASAQEVQIATERDAANKFINPVILTVTWDEDIVTEIPDHKSTDDDSLQEWYVPVEGGYKMFTFERSELGEYAVRWRTETGGFWSDWGVCTVTLPGTPTHKD